MADGRCFQSFLTIYSIMRENISIEHIFSELYSVPENIRKGYHKVKAVSYTHLDVYKRQVDPEKNRISLTMKF